MNRFFIDEIAGNINKITDKEDIKHILKVLRLDIGDEVEIVDSTKKEYINHPNRNNAIDNLIPSVS